MSIANLEGALCVGEWWLFESTEKADHLVAAEICAKCPALDNCRRLLQQETSSYPWGGSGPVGTWAGELLGSRGTPKWKAKA